MPKKLKFSKYTWIEASIFRNPKDLRSESYKIDESTIKVLETLGSQDDIEERKRWILPLCKNSLEEIYKLHKEKNVSLGIFKPYEVYDLIIDKATPEWTPEQQMCIDQMSYLDQHFVKLEKVPYDFSFKFKCSSDCNTIHNMKITDWEIYQAYRSFKDYYKDEEVALKKLKEKWMGFFNDTGKSSYFIVGTVHPWPTFIILGIFSYKIKEEKVDKPKKKDKNFIEGQTSFL